MTEPASNLTPHDFTPRDFARCIDHTLLKPEATAEDIQKLCAEARTHHFVAVCVNPMWIPGAVEALAGTDTCVATVIGFPLGATRAANKRAEAIDAAEQGARELDLVVPLGSLKAGDRSTVVEHISAVVDGARRVSEDSVVKVILETGALTDEQIILGCRCAAVGQADFVKTSTGFHPSGGAQLEHVKLMHKHATPMKIKASGGIRTLSDARAMLAAGAARLGTSAGVALIEAFRVEVGETA